MRKLKMILLMLSFAGCIHAQSRELLPVNWEDIRKEATENPQRVKDLVERLSAPKIDTTLTYPERILAFYGQSFLTQDAEDAYKDEMWNLYKKGKLEDCLTVAKKMLDINPLNLNALNTAGNVLHDMAKDSVRWQQATKEDAGLYYRRAMRIFNTIAMTGDGSDEHPFYVTKVSDEYNFMRYYLDLWEYQMQQATACCDIITLDEISRYYDRPTIYFEITRVYELERLMFQPKTSKSKKKKH